MSKIKEEKKPNPNAKNIPLTFKVSREEYNLISVFATTFTGGNVSQWLRVAALRFEPKKKDF